MGSTHGCSTSLSPLRVFVHRTAIRPHRWGPQTSARLCHWPFRTLRRALPSALHSVDISRIAHRCFAQPCSLASTSPHHRGTHVKMLIRTRGTSHASSTGDLAVQLWRPAVRRTRRLATTPTGLSQRHLGQRDCIVGVLARNVLRAWRGALGEVCRLSAASSRPTLGHSSSTSRPRAQHALHSSPISPRIRARV